MLISLSFTSLSVLGFLGCLFMMSLSACSYAREIAGTFGDGIRLLLEPLLFATVHSHPCLTFSAWERVLPKNPRHSIQVRISPLFHPPHSALTDKERMLRCGEPVSILLSHTYNPSTKENCIWTFSSYYFLKGTRNPHFFLRKKKRHSPCQCPSQCRGWWLFPVGEVCLQWWRSGKAWFQECYWSRCKQSTSSGYQRSGALRQGKDKHNPCLAAEVDHRQLQWQQGKVKCYCNKLKSSCALKGSLQGSNACVHRACHHLYKLLFSGYDNPCMQGSLHTEVWY